MKVFHGSIEIVEKPLVNIGRNNLDFGKGFYVTNLKAQAISWASRPMNIGNQKFLNIYELSDKIKEKDFNVLRFDKYNKEWLDFVVGNRRGENLWQPYDMIIGGIANDRVFNTVELYSAGLITSDEALQRLEYHKPNNQICILNQDIINNYLDFVESIKIEENDKR